MVDLLRANGGENIKIYGGGGGVIVPAEIKELMGYGVARLYSPEDGASMGLQGMINDVIRGCDYDLTPLAPKSGDRSEEHTSELQSLMRISYAVFCLKKKKKHKYRSTAENIART